MSGNHEQNWLFGRFAHIEFANGGAPVARPRTNMHAHEGCASYSDPQTGELLLYANGYTVWDGNHNVVTSGLEGSGTATQTVVIVPPPAGGTLFHIFTVGANGGGLQVLNGEDSPLSHSSYSVTGSGASLSVQQVSPPSALFGGVNHNERLTCASNSDGTGYWVIAQPANMAQFHLVSIMSDTPQTMPAQVAGAPAQESIAELGYMRVSPDGKTLAYCDSGSSEIVFCDFDASTGQIGYRCNLSTPPGCYGLEFSADSQLVYYTFERQPSSNNDPNLFQAPVPQSDAQHANSTVLHSVGSTDGAFGALQMAPDGKIYIIRNQEPYLSVITNPSVAGTGCGFVEIAPDASGAPLVIDEMGLFGLPNFMRMVEPEIIHEDLSCAQIAGEVNDAITGRVRQLEGELKPCEEREELGRCSPLELPKIEPYVAIHWEHRDCGGVAPRTCTVMVVSVVNRYSNVTLSNVVINRLRVTDMGGGPVELTEEGLPSLEIVPIGPYCFGDIGPCQHISREFTLHGRRAQPDEYRILVEGLCFDVCLHQDKSACFSLVVCDE